jgi:hypothetical protein
VKDDVTEDLTGDVSVVAAVKLPGRPPVRLPGGRRLTFGRGGEGRPVDLQVSHSPRVSRQAGTLEVTPYGVLVTNTGSNPLLVRGDGEAGVLAVRPGQAHLVAHGTARVGFAGASDFLEITAPGPVGPDQEHQREEELTVERTAPAFALAPGTAYYACLVALCEPTLRNPGSPWVPTSKQIAERLFEAGLTGELRTGDWVDRRLDDVRAKLPIGEQEWSAERARHAGETERRQAMVRERSGAPRRSARKEQLVEFAVTHGLVTMGAVEQLLGPPSS